MKKLLHPDYWVEIPAGEFLTGLSDEQRREIAKRVIGGYMPSRPRTLTDEIIEKMHHNPPNKQQLLESIVSKLSQYPPEKLTLEEEKIYSEETFRAYDAPLLSLFHFLSPAKKRLLEQARKKLQRYPHLTSEEWKVLEWHLQGDFDNIHAIEERLMDTPPQQTVWVDRFYISRFPLTGFQDDQFFFKHVSASELLGALEEPISEWHDSPTFQGVKYKIIGRTRSKITSTQKVLRLCDALGGRIPMEMEWEKAARGTDGRLYPWGNEWRLDAGYFFRGQTSDERCEAVDAYPLGVSPYGVWGMMGVYPEMVAREQPRRFNEQGLEIKGKILYYAIKGSDIRVSQAGTAQFDYLAPLPGWGDYISFRPVLDKWPVQQWQGFSAEDKEKGQE